MEKPTCYELDECLITNTVILNETSYSLKFSIRYSMEQPTVVWKQHAQTMLEVWTVFVIQGSDPMFLGQAALTSMNALREAAFVKRTLNAGICMALIIVPAWYGFKIGIHYYILESNRD